MRKHVYWVSILILAGLTSCSKVQENQSPAAIEASHASDKDRAQTYLGWQFKQCRNVHFKDKIMQGFGDYVTLIYLELPDEETKALLDRLLKLGDYDNLKRNETNLKVMERIGSEYEWWDVHKHRNVLCTTTSWFRVHGNDKIYSHSTVAVARLSGKWNAVYIHFVDEAL